MWHMPWRSFLVGLASLLGCVLLSHIHTHSPPRDKVVADRLPARELKGRKKDPLSACVYVVHFKKSFWSAIVELCVQFFNWFLCTACVRWLWLRGGIPESHGMRESLLWKEGCREEKRQLSIITVRLEGIQIHIHRIGVSSLALVILHAHGWHSTRTCPTLNWVPTHCQWCRVLGRQRGKHAALNSSLPTGETDDTEWPLPC